MWIFLASALAGPPPDEVSAPPCADTDRAVQRTLRRHARDDQRERRKQQYDGMAERDAVRLAYVHEQLEAERVCAPDDAWHAGVVLQHSGASADHRRAFDLFAYACDHGVGSACDWAPLAWDRSLVSAGEPQWYGTQWQGRLDEETGEHLGMCLVAVDPASTDAARRAVGRPPLDELVREAYARNHREPPPDASLETLEADGMVCPAVAW